MIREALSVSFPVVPEPHNAAMIQVDKFPIVPEMRASWANFLLSWVRSLASEHSLRLAVWIQTTSLHEGDTAELVRRHGALWLPEIGLGVWPDREPPRLWTAEDFQQLDLGQKPPPLMHTVFHVSGGIAATEHALSTLAGSGTLVFALLPTSVEVFHEKVTSIYLPAIRDEALRGYSFYLPLLDSRSLKTAAAALDEHESQLSRWLGHAPFFLQENKTEESVLVVSSLKGAMDALQKWTEKQEQLSATDSF
jgi:hypothetical protein